MVNCPLCHATHPESVSAKGKPYAYCHESHSTLWLTSPIVRRNLGLGPNNGGYTARENPVAKRSYSADEPAMVVETVGPAEPIEGEWDDAEPHPLALLCSKCGVPIRNQGLEACSGCGEPIVWE